MKINQFTTTNFSNLKSKFIQLLFILLIFGFTYMLNGCTQSNNNNNNTNTLSNAKAIISYSLNGTGSIIADSNISVVMPYGTSVTNLIATFITNGTNVTVNNVAQISGVTPNNFTSPVIYTVSAANGTKTTYTVTVKVASISSKSITRYSLNGTNGLINGLNIYVVMPFGTNPNSLTASFLTTGTSVSVNNILQVSGQTVNNFTNPVVYSVFAGDGSIANYTVTVTIASNTSKAITEYSLNGRKGKISGFNISVVMPYGTDVTGLIATFTTTGQRVSVGSIAQISGQTVNNFTIPVPYIVYAADGSSANYTVTVTMASNSSKAITEYSLNGTRGIISGFNISVIMPNGTNVTNLIATFTTTGANVSVAGVTQISKQTENNFTNPIVYTVTAIDGTTANYIVTVTVSPSSANAITDYSINGTSGIIVGFNISVVMPYGTNITNLIATFTTTGTSVTVNNVNQVSGQTENNFTSPLVYTVTAANGATATYTVTVTISPNTAVAITKYSLNGTNGTITGSNISVIMPYGTNVTSLIATFTTTGTSVTVNNVNQVSGQTENNFTSPLVYTVTAANGATATYTVTVTISANTANAITFYSLNGTTGIISGLNISVVMPAGTIVTNLIATFNTTGASVAINSTTQVSGQTANNFTNPVIYTVTAASGATAIYTVTVTVATNPAKAITAFSLNGISSVISGLNIYVNMPFNTNFNVTNLIATFTTTGQSVAIGSTTQVSGQTTNSFTNAVTYTVTAADGSTANYTVSVNAGANQTSLGDTPNGIATTPNGSYLYAATSGQYIDWWSINTITGIISSGGHLQLLDVPTSVAASNSYLFAGTYGQYIDSFSINQSTGAVTFLSNLKLGDTANSLAVSPSGAYLYAGTTGGYIDWFSINQSTGAVTFLGNLQLQDIPTGVVVSPNGNYLYAVTNGGSNNYGFVDYFSINQSTGAVTFLGNLQLQDEPLNVTISPDGTTLYATTNGGYVDGFTINQNNGSITFKGNYFFAAGEVFSGIANSLNNSYLYLIGQTAGNTTIGWINPPLY